MVKDVNAQNQQLLTVMEQKEKIQPVITTQLVAMTDLVLKKFQN